MYFDEFKHQLPDIDPQETDEWLASLDDVVGEEGENRARFLMFKLLKRARQLHVGLPPLTQTRYINTISPEQEPFFPGDEQLELRIRRIIRWNAVAMVLRSNNQFPGIGGHLSTYASSASLYEVGFNHFFLGKDAEGGGDQVYYQGHAAPGMYARAFLEGRLSEEQLDHFRREVSGKGLSSSHARVLGVSDRLHGTRSAGGHLPGSIQPLSPEPGHEGHLRAACLGIPRRRRNGRAGGAGWPLTGGPRRPRQPHLRRELQPAAPGWPGARQRQDHPGARGPVPRRRLERHQGHLGSRVG